MITTTARAITAELRKLHPHVKGLSTATGEHAGEYRVRLPVSSFTSDGGAWGIAHILNAHLGTRFGVDGVSYHGTRDAGRVADVSLHTRTPERVRSEEDRELCRQNLARDSEL